MSENKESVRIWFDGCFDMYHFGHANALRQAKQLGDQLIVGIHSDEEIIKNKGRPVMSEKERYHMLKCMKWVDEVVENAPYLTGLDIMAENNCDFCAHGDDISVGFDGQDSFYEVKKAKKFKQFKRTQGVSTTDLVKRMLNLSLNHDCQTMNNSEREDISSYTKGCNFYPNTLLINHFQENCSEPTDDDVVIYVPGSFDLFHVGHCMLLEECAKLGTHIVVGLYSDADIKLTKGVQYPVMGFHGRLLSVLSCKFVSNVILAPPLAITKQMIESLKISTVVHGKIDLEKLEKYFKVPRDLDKFRVIDSGCKLTFFDIINKVHDQKEEYMKRNKKKETKEINYKSNTNNKSN